MKSNNPRKNTLNTVKLLSNRQVDGGDSPLDHHLAAGVYRSAKSFYHKTVQGHFGCVNALEFSNGAEEFLASGETLLDQENFKTLIFLDSSDDRRVLVWRSADLMLCSTRPKNIKMKSEHNSNIFCLAFTRDNETLLSAGNDSQVIVHCLKTGQSKDVYLLEDSVYALSCHPESSNIFCTASEDGKLTVFDLRAPKMADPCIMAKSHCSYQSVMFNPVESVFLLSTNEKEGVNLWDTRRPRKPVLVYDNVRGTKSAMCARWNNRGNLILALRRRQLPSLYSIGLVKPIAFFDDAGYFNACTLKSCTFGGPDDKYVMTGSDNFDCYVWPIPDLGDWSPDDAPKIVEQPLTLIGHRSIVNQVRYSHSNHLLASSGVEKIIKLWSIFPMVEGRGALVLENDDEDSKKSTATATPALQFSPKRELYSERDFDRYVTLRGDLTTIDNSGAGQETTNMAEDPGMLAFFDSIVRMEMTGVIGDRELSRFSLLDSDSDESSNGGRLLTIRGGQYRNEVVSSMSSSSSSSSDDELPISNRHDVDQDRDQNSIVAIVQDGQSVVLGHESDPQSASTSGDNGRRDENDGHGVSILGWSNVRLEIYRNGLFEELGDTNRNRPENVDDGITNNENNSAERFRHTVKRSRNFRRQTSSSSSDDETGVGADT